MSDTVLCVQPVPILLDAIAGTSVYNRTLSIRQALEAYVATVVQQSYIGKQLNSLHSTSAASSNFSGIQSETQTQTQMQAIAFRVMFQALNESLYRSYVRRGDPGCAAGGAGPGDGRVAGPRPQEGHSAGGRAGEGVRPQRARRAELPVLLARAGGEDRPC